MSLNRTSATRRTLLKGLAASTALGGIPSALFAAPLHPYQQASLPVALRVADLLGRMTIEEKVAQMLCIWTTKSKIQTTDGQFSAAAARANFPHGLGMIARPSDHAEIAPIGSAPGRAPSDRTQFARAAQQWALEKTRLGIPLFLHEEALHGLAAPAGTSFPQAIALASSFDTELVERVFTVAGREAAISGANMVLAPVVDIARDPRWGRVEETFGEDPWLVAEMGKAAVRGMQGASLPLGPDKVLATLKAIGAHGQPDNGTNAGPAMVGERTLREEFLPPFHAAISQLPVLSVMAAYNEIDGVPSHANAWLLHKVLREEWGFGGIVVSDYGGLSDLIGRHRVAASRLDAAQLALKAGVDVEMADPDVYAQVADWVRTGAIAQADVDRVVGRILKVKFEAGLFERAAPDPALAERQTGTAASAALAREAAVKSAILLKNRAETLPLDRARLKRLAVIGPNAADVYLGGYSGTPRAPVSLLEGIRAAAGDVVIEYAEGVRLTEGGHDWLKDQVELADPAENRRRIAEAVTVARGTDAIVLAIGGNEQTSREAWADEHLGDRARLDLIGEQQELVDAMAALGKPLIVVLINGGPLAIEKTVDAADALLECWYAGEQGGHAIADILFGRASPGGKLPVTIPRSVGQLPVFYRRKPSARRGYLFDTTEPLFPFGFGLSYSRFAISAPRAGRASIARDESVAIAVDVSNLGTREADEVVQLYLRDEQSSVTRPVLELKRFQRVTLAPGETRTLQFTLGPDDFALWNDAMVRVVEPGRFTLMAGGSSVDLKSATLEIS
jgi:beta-glucosidase